MEMQWNRTKWLGIAAGAAVLLALVSGCPEEDDGPGTELSDSGVPDTQSDAPPSEACETPDETSCNGVDSDNDGVVDDGCNCNYEGLSVGVCSNGTIQCDGSCAPPTYYMEDESGQNACDGRDNDCDGDTDEVGDIACAKTQGVCAGATADCTSGSFEMCRESDYGPNYHDPERLCDGMDNDCDGSADDGCSFSILDGTASDDRMLDADTAPNGALYAVGESDGGLGETDGGVGTDFDAVVAKYNADGSEAWINSVGTDADDQANAVDVGPNGGVVVGGDSFGDITGDGVSLDGDQDGFVAKYDSSGNEEWIFSVRTDQQDSVKDVVVLPDGRVAMVGTTQGDFDNSQSQTGTDAIIGVIASDGEELEWRAHLASDQFAYDAFTEVTIGPNNSLYAVGETEGEFIANAQASNDQGDAVVAKYGFGGSPAWVRVFGRQGSEDKPNAVTPVVGQDETGVWIAGETRATVGDSGTNAGEFDGFLLQIDGTGNAGDNFNFGTPNTERITGLTVATGGDQPEIYVIGETNGDLVGGRPPAVGFLPFITQVSVGSGGGAQLNGLYYGTPETTETALVRRGDGGVVAVGYHRQTEFLNKTPTGGEDFYIIEHRPFPDCFPGCNSNQ